MEMEGSRSGQQRWKCPKKRRAAKEICYENNMMNLLREGKAPLRLLTRKSKKPLNTIPENSVAVFDNTCSDYDWLCSGWITEEHVKPNNRLYRYHYDPLGQMYNTQYAVDCMSADIEKDHELSALDK